MADAHHTFLERFVEVCMADPRILAAFLGGSHAKGYADRYSDLDLTVIVSDAAFEEQQSIQRDVLEPLGDLLFLEHFSYPNLAFCIYADGIECELWLASPSRLEHIHCGAYRPLLDKTGILTDIQFPEERLSPDEQLETVRYTIAVFWHDLSHFITAMARGQPWWAYGQIGALQRICMDLARLRLDPSQAPEGHEKVDLALPADLLAPLAATCCACERNAMLLAAQRLVELYQEQAHALAATHGLEYPTRLERVMLERMALLEATA